MTRAAAALAALLALAACGGDEAPQAPGWARPAVDPSDLGVACPAPDVPVLIDSNGGIGERATVRADEVAVGDWIGLGGWSQVTSVRVVPDVARLELVMEDGRAGLFTADHAFEVRANLSESQAFLGMFRLMDLVPGDVLWGTVPGVVADVRAAPAGDVVEISVAYAGVTMVNMGLTSLAHNAPTPPPR